MFSTFVGLVHRPRIRPTFLIPMPRGWFGKKTLTKPTD